MLIEFDTVVSIYSHVLWECLLSLQYALPSYDSLRRVEVVYVLGVRLQSSSNDFFRGRRKM